MNPINMSKIFLFITAVVFSMTAKAQDNTAVKSPPDTVKLGIYVTSIHDIDFKDKEYSISFWLWLKYKNKDFNFADNLEIPNAKTVSRSFATTDSSNGRIYMLMKIQCTMKDSWKIGNFPFDRQKLRLSFENSQYDSSALVFIPDTLGDHFDKRFTLNGWGIDSFSMAEGRKEYKTTFGDESLSKPDVMYSSLKVKIGIDRDATGLFWKMFLGMYLAFLIAYVSFYIHADGMDSRFALSVGSVFAVIGNKYIIDSALPESTSFTLVDMLHGFTLFAIFMIITATALSLHYIKRDQLKKAKKVDTMAAIFILLIYVIANIFFIYRAGKSG